MAKAQISRTVALEILKTAGSTSPAATAELTSALKAVSLLGILEGNFPPLQTFASYYSSYVNSISIGAQNEALSVDELTSDVGTFSAFINFIMVLLAALGLNACELEQLITLATSLSLRLGAKYRSNVLRLSLTVALETSLNNFGTSVKTWIKVPVVGPPPRLNVAVEKLIEARDAIEQFQARDLTVFGFKSLLESPPHSLSTPQGLSKPTTFFHVTSDSEKRKRETSPERLDPGPQRHGQTKSGFCKEFLNDKCDFYKCKFNHFTLDELKAIPCRQHAKFGSCPHGDQCVYQHSN